MRRRSSAATTLAITGSGRAPVATAIERTVSDAGVAVAAGAVRTPAAGGTPPGALGAGAGRLLPPAGRGTAPAAPRGGRRGAPHRGLGGPREPRRFGGLLRRAL